jgi:hypothetical protein
MHDLEQITRLTRQLIQAEEYLLQCQEEMNDAELQKERVEQALTRQLALGGEDLWLELDDRLVQVSCRNGRAHVVPSDRLLRLGVRRDATA